MTNIQCVCVCVCVCVKHLLCGSVLLCCVILWCVCVCEFLLINIHSMCVVVVVVVVVVCAYLSTHTVYQYKIHFFHYFGGIWPYWKTDTGKHNYHEILLLF